ncbi:UbiE/COQ5 methyltransferase [Maioricimonas rarisocia]|uniref:Demethylmenaquinone methyltransferase n=1 Tax=Maioricimonas rarisocia TaxID=2528026 RepID=A0A517Z542_9PLAN|nr:bifunctional demethylmenaquinone methyltransferase/2-methoxy-6-polyprenyl-1,4-benzoquinol methylase UbiE [Maioricimonas rarisocia]QDU37596.1 UbiE/COQ5 methyltransferase [Maioricimonas rarisocia]
MTQATVDKSNQRVRRMFGEIAPRYDLMNHVLSGGVDYWWRWRTVRLVPPTGDAPILDVCTGTGDLAFAYRKKSGGRVPVIGTDFTFEMLQRAREKGKSSDVAFMEADTQVLPFPSETFQIVSVAFGLRNVCDTQAGLREMTRVCAPGGHVAILEFSKPTNPVFKRVYAAYFKHVLPRIGQLFAKNQHDAYNYLPESVAQFPEGQALAALMEEAGLDEVRFHPLTFGIATLYIGRKPAATS